jgi:hypothetical protein
MTLIVVGDKMSELDIQADPAEDEFAYVQEIAGKFKEALEDKNLREDALTAIKGIRRGLSDSADNFLLSYFT